MKTIKSTNFKRSLAGLKAHNAEYFAKHPTETWRWVKLVSPDGRQWATVKLKNPFITS